MHRTTRSVSLAVVTLTALFGLSARTQAQSIVVTAEAAGVQSSQVANVTTETFNTAATGNTTTLSSSGGTYTASTGSSFSIQSADSFGGANGTGNYFSVSNGQGPTTLALNGSQAYFGFWWSAADANDLVQLYSGNNLIGSFNAASTLGSLGSAYFGNPNQNQSGDTNEKFAYINFFGQGGTTFDRVVFSQTTGDGGFESDNHSFSTDPETMTGTVISGGFTPAAAVPEPAFVQLGSLVVVGGAGLLFRKRRK